MRKLLFVFAALFAFGALAQPAVLTPASPTSSDIITASVVVLPCDRTLTTTVTGSLVRTTVSMPDCGIIILPPLIRDTTTFGPLPAGSYTYEVYHDFGGTDPPTLVSRQQFLVQAPPIPALSTWGLIAMAAGLALVALLRR